MKRWAAARVVLLAAAIMAATAQAPLPAGVGMTVTQWGRTEDVPLLKR